MLQDYIKIIEVMLLPRDTSKLSPMLMMQGDQGWNGQGLYVVCKSKVELCNSLFKKSPPERRFGTCCTPVQVQSHQTDGHVWGAGTPWRLCASLAVTKGHHTSHRLTSWAATQYWMARCKITWKIEEVTSNRRGHPAPGVRIYNSSRILIAT